MRSKKESKKVLGNFSLKYRDDFQAIIKEQLYLKSPLRNQFQVRPISDGELPIFNKAKVSYIIGEDGSKILAVSNKRVIVPFFELECNRPSL